VLNLADDQSADGVVSAVAPLVRETPHTAVIALPAKLEMELSELSPEDAAEFLQALGVSSSELDPSPRKPTAWPS